MRLWSLHPRYLDRAGLLALWREALLAQAVLRGETRGYRHHPQLIRFRSQATPEAAIAAFLKEVHREASRRGYLFNAERIGRLGTAHPFPVTRGQLLFEREHLLAKLALRDPAAHEALRAEGVPKPHPLFTVVPGGTESWERSC